MTLREFVNVCYSSRKSWAEILVFDSEEDIEAFVEKGDELGIQFTIKGERSMMPIRHDVTEAEIECIYPVGKNIIAVCCLDLFEICYHGRSRKKDSAEDGE